MALDNASFVEAGEAAKDNDLYGAVLYGIGNSTEAVYYLDAGWAQCLVAPDEFDAGYESVAELIKKRHNFFYKMKTGRLHIPFSHGRIFFRRRTGTCCLQSAGKIRGYHG